MTNTKKEILTATSGIAAAGGVTFTISYATSLLGGIAWGTGHKISGAIIFLTGQALAQKKGWDAFDWSSNHVAEMLDLDYWWRLPQNKDKETEDEKKSEMEA